MPGNGNVFISHAYQDTERCQALLAALRSWGVDYWFAEQRDEADETLSPRVEQAIAERDIFLRISTAAADSSHWVRLETEAFRRLRAEERAAEEVDRRTLIVLGLDRRAERPPLEAGEIFIDSAGASVLRWRPELRAALGLDAPSAAFAGALPDALLGPQADVPADATAALPRIARKDVRRDMLDDLRALATDLRLRGPDDSVVSVAVAGRTAERPAGDSMATARRRAVLEMVEGKYAGRTYELRNPRVTLGRKLDRDIFIEDLAVSRRHAAIMRDEQGRFVIQDENSTNGTYVNERPVTERALADGDTIRLGGTAFRVRLPRALD